MASGRLQRKINNAEPGQYGNLLESFVDFGTALPSLADPKAKDSNEFKPIWEQEVYDEQGRRRLHGAFTGGWSAGYFNTVGSKEGWAPSTFKSSRASRAADSKGKSIQEQAQQFMDDEDLAELASSRTLQTSSTYSAPAPSDYDPLMGVFGPSASASPAAAPGASAALASLIQGADSRIGAKLMRRMGWREGQGVGPRLTLEQRKAQVVELGLPLSHADEEDDVAGEAAKHYFAPVDRPLALLNAVGSSQDRGWGLGYKAEKGIDRARGDTLGRTAVEDDEDDVYGSYGREPERDDRRKLSVVELDDMNDDFYGPPRPSAGARRDRRAPPPSRRSAGVFHDGQPVLAGFALDTRPPPVASTSQLPPSPPSDWKPNPSRLWAEPAPASSGEKGKVKQQLDPDQRGTLLGETQPEPEREPAPAAVLKSVFDYLSAKSRERLGMLTNAPTTSTNSTPLANLRSAHGHQAQARAEPDGVLEIPQLEPVTAKAALRGFQPFSAQSTSADPIKQARYTLFLQHQASSPSQSTPLPFGPRKLPNGAQQTILELNRELEDYAKAAHVFKPVSGLLASRFATGASPGSDVPKVEPGLYQPPPKPAAAAVSSTSAGEGGAEPEPVKLTPVQQAIQDGQFGPLTRMVENWKPAALLCKRFGVPDPYKAQRSGGGDELESGAGGAWRAPTSTKSFAADGRRAGPSELLSQGSIDMIMQDPAFKRFNLPAGAGEELGEDVLGDRSRLDRSAAATGEDESGRARPARADIPTMDQVGLGDDERQGEELLQPKAPKEVFAAIFADSDDSDMDLDDDDDELVGAAEGGAGAVGPGVAPPAEEPKPAEVSLRPEDVASYKPTFASSRSKPDSSIPTKGKSSKSSSKRKLPSSALSFDVDDGEEGERGLVIKPKKKKAAKASSKEHRLKHAPMPKAVVVDDDVEMEWVEAPSVGVEVQSAAQGPPAPAPAAPPPARAGARARASDLF